MTVRSVLVTGAGGFVGSALVDGFAERGWAVIAVDRHFDEGEAAPGVERVVSDLGTGSVTTTLPAADLVIHAAWITADPVSLGVTDDDYREMNLRPLLAVLEHVESTAPESFVFVSSSGVFAPTDGEGGLRDRDRPTGTSAYATAKVMGERITLDSSSTITTAHVVRLGYLFGPGESARSSRPGVSLVARWLESARAGGLLEVREDDPAREWTFVADLAPVLAELLSTSPPQGPPPIHLGSPHVLHDQALAALIAERIPGAEVSLVAAGAPVKPPMVASDAPAIRDFEWTTPSKGLDAILGAGVAP